MPDKCKEYGGILHPHNSSKCCASSCAEFCGAIECENGVGGESSCCASGIKDEIICGSNEQAAPCTIGKK